jgi:hypothetical protein
MECAYCGRPIDSRSAWRGITGQFFCGEFCADSEIETFMPAADAPAYVTKVPQPLRAAGKKQKSLVPARWGDGT